MGNFLIQIEQVNELTTTCPLVNLPLSKVREYHGNFKGLCDNFAINFKEFEMVFQSNQATFSMWDTDNNGLLDALELFAGLIMFSLATTEEKIRFLFDLFDFNEIQSISLVDLEFCLQCVVISTSKIYEIGEDVSDQEVHQLVDASFPRGARLSIIQLIKWAAESKEASIYFKKFKIPIPTSHGSSEVSKKKTKTSLKQAEAESKVQSQVSQSSKSNNYSTFFNSKRNKFFRAWLYITLQPLISYRIQNKTIHNFIKQPNEVKAQLEWVYGIRCEDAKRALQYTVNKSLAQSTGTVSKYDKKKLANNEELVYFTSCIVILLNIKLSTQRYYLEHTVLNFIIPYQQEILSLAVSNTSGEVVASGEVGTEPKIHIWNCRTLKNIAVLEGIHKKGIHLLSFTTNDKYLITCGILAPSPVIIYDWQEQTVLVSTSVASVTLDLFVLPKVTVKHCKQQFTEDNHQTERILVLTKKEFLVFIIRKDEFNTHSLSYSQGREFSKSPVVCGVSIPTDSSNRFTHELKKPNDFELQSQNHLILTGHADGTVVIWKLLQCVGVLDKYETKITYICKCFEGVAIGTEGGYIYIWDSELSECRKVIKLESLPFTFKDYRIVSMDYNQKKLLVLTMGGDALEIHQSVRNIHKVKANMVSSIIKIEGTIRGLSLLNQIERTVLIGGDTGVVYYYDLTSHELLDTWAIGSKITALACVSLEEGGFTVACGSNEGILKIRQHWEDAKSRSHECGTMEITDVKFSKNGMQLAVGSLDQNVYLFNYQKQDYMGLAACKLLNGHAVSINFSQDSSKMVICTNQRKILVLESQNFSYDSKVEDVQETYWQSWIGRYPLATKSISSGNMPICLGSVTNIVAAGDEKGIIYIWKNVENIKDNIGLNFRAHSSEISRLELTLDDNRLVSVGLRDHTLCQWKLEQLKNDEEEHLSVEHQDQLIQRQYMVGDDKLQITDESLLNELNYCRIDLAKAKGKPEEAKFDNTVLIRGSSSATINKILAQQAYEGQGSDWQKPPTISLVLEHIYGIQTAGRRNTLVYCHCFQEADKKKAKMSRKQMEDLIKSLGIEDITEGQMQEMLVQFNLEEAVVKENKEKKIRFDINHKICERFMVYFTSRVAVLYNPANNQQRFYQGHSLKISALAQHPIQPIMATGEVSQTPQIHIWNAFSLETLSIIQSSHQGGILHLGFSGDGVLLISIGMDPTYTLQVFNWKQKTSLAFRSTGFQPIFGVKFNPFTECEFITCGYEHLSVWKLNGSHLTCVNSQKILSNVSEDKGIKLLGEKEEQRCTLMCFDFRAYRQGVSISVDIVIGTNLGEMAVFAKGMYKVVHQKAHDGSINCLRMTDSLTESHCLLTGGEDGCIKIWTAQLQPLQTIELNKSSLLEDYSSRRHFGIQSLDVYSCSKTTATRILFGMRCGEIRELIISLNDGKKNQSSKLNKQKQNQSLDAFAVEIFSYMSSHSSLKVSPSQRKVSVAIHPRLRIVASIGDDETLRFWDFVSREIFVSTNLGDQATYLAFSPEGQFLAVGFISGKFLLLNSQLNQVDTGKYLYDANFLGKIALLFVDPIMTAKESKAAILTVKFSFRGDFIAVSYDNELRFEVINTHSNVTQVSKKESSFVQLYVARESSRNPGIKIAAKQLFVKLDKIVLPMAELQASAQLRCKLAVTQMDFSEDDSFILMGCQKLDTELQRDYEDREEFFVIWDITKRIFTNEYDKFKDVFWSSWSLSNSIHARYQGIKMWEQEKEEHKEGKIENSCPMSAVVRFRRDLEGVVCGSTRGDLYAFRFSSLILEGGEEKEFAVESLQKSGMSLAKGAVAHSSMIQSLTLFEQFGIKQNVYETFVFSSSFDDQCIMQWKVDFSHQMWELDLNNFIASKNDPFVEVPTLEKFKIMQNEIWNHRLDVAETILEIEKEVQFDELNEDEEESKQEKSAYQLVLDTVIGRRAFDRRSNVKVDCQNRIVYNAGSQMIFLEKNTDPKEEKLIKQSFLKPEGLNGTKINPEISVFCLSEDKRLLLVGTTQLKASLMVWEISTHILLTSIHLENCCIILTLKLAFDNQTTLLVVIVLFKYCRV